MGTKVCSICNKELDKSMFYKKKGYKHGVSGQCKECVKERANKYHEEHKESDNKRTKKYGKQYYKDNKGKEFERNKKYRETHKEQEKATAKIYYEANKEHITVVTKKYQSEHKEECSTRSKEYNGANKEHITKQKQQYYKDNKEYILVRCKEYVLLDPEKKRVRDKVWSHDNRDKQNVKKQRRRAKELKLLSTLTEQQWENVKLIFENKCCYCGEEKKLEQEHFISVINLGPYTHDNIVCACKSCNNSKGPKRFEDWYPSFKHYSKLREQKILLFLNYDRNNNQQLSIL